MVLSGGTVSCFILLVTAVKHEIFKKNGGTEANFPKGKQVVLKIPLRHAYTYTYTYIHTYIYIYVVESKLGPRCGFFE